MFEVATGVLLGVGVNWRERGMRRHLAKLGQGVLYGVLGTAGGGVATLLAGAAIARLLPLEMFGLYFLFLSSVRLFSLFHGLGLHRGLLKLIGIAAEDARAAEIRSIARNAALLFALATLGLAVLAALAWLPIRWLELNAGTAITGAAVALFVAAVVLRSFEEIAAAFFRALGYVRAGVLLLSLPREVMLAVVFGAAVLAGSHLDLTDALLLYVVAAAIPAAVTLVVILRVLARRRPAHSATDTGACGVSEMAQLCFPMMLFGASTVVYGSAAVWALSLYGDFDELGLFGAAARVTLVIGLALRMVNLVLPPTVASLYARGRVSELEALLRTVASWSLLAGLGGLMFFALLGGDILALVFGPEFRRASTILLILALGEAINAVGGSPGVLLQMSGHHALLTRIAVVNGVFTLVACLVLVPLAGAEGAAAATAVGVLGQKVAVTVMAWRRTGIKTLPNLRLLSSGPVAPATDH